MLIEILVMRMDEREIGLSFFLSNMDEKSNLV
jgi:hypothetical protein